MIRSVIWYKTLIATTIHFRSVPHYESENTKKNFEEEHQSSVDVQLKTKKKRL